MTAGTENRGAPASFARGKMKIESKKSVIALKGKGYSLQIQPCSLQFIGICLQK